MVRVKSTKNLISQCMLIDSNGGFFFDCLVFNYFRFHEAAEGKASPFPLDGKHTNSALSNPRRSLNKGGSGAAPESAPALEQDEMTPSQWCLCCWNSPEHTLSFIRSAWAKKGLCSTQWHLRKIPIYICSKQQPVHITMFAFATHPTTEDYNFQTWAHCSLCLYVYI